MPICHCALVKNLLHSEVNCPEVLVRTLEEGEERDRSLFSSCVFIYLFILAQKCLISIIAKANVRTFSFE